MIGAVQVCLGIRDPGFRLKISQERGAIGDRAKSNLLIILMFEAFMRQPALLLSTISLCTTTIAMAACGGGGGNSVTPPLVNSGSGGAPNVPVTAPSQAPFSPHVVEFNDPDASPAAIITGLDGNLYYTGGNVPFYGRITPSGITTDIPIQGSGGQSNLILGPDNAFYFLDQTTYIGRIDVNGAITKTTFNSYGNDFSGLVVGPDQNIWFTTGSGTIGVLVPGSTQISRTYHLPANGSGGRLVVGGDKNLWLVDNGNNAIARITTAGAISEFPVTESNAGLTNLTAGPDGSIWFAEANTFKIGHIALSGTFLPTLSFLKTDSAYGLQFGPDGKLYAVVGNPVNGNAIDQIDVSTGAIARFSHGHQGATGITVGPDGNIWFAETGGIGQLIIHS